MHLPEIPPRRGARRRDRHGRGVRGPLIPPALPAWKSRSEQFDRIVSRAAAKLLDRNESLAGTEFGVEEIPPSDPSPWEEHAVTLGRAFPADRATGVPARVVIYRMPVVGRVEGTRDTAEFVGMVLAEQAAGLLGVQPWDVDPDYPRD
ncbi:MAG: metallopeptidase family protein [bacterium]|nr:metallopeptidase family protein [bacterium]